MFSAMPNTGIFIIFTILIPLRTIMFARSCGEDTIYTPVSYTHLGQRGHSRGAAAGDWQTADRHYDTVV